MIDKFFLLFQTDALKAAADVGKADSAIMQMGRDTDDVRARIDTLGGQLVNTFSKIALPVLGLAAAMKAVKATFSFANEISELNGLAARAGTTTTQLDLLARASDALGPGKGAASTGLLNISKAMSGATGASLQFRDGLAVLGVQMRNSDGSLRNTTEVFLDLAAAMQGADQFTSGNLLRRMGFDAASVALILKGRTAILDAMDAQKKLGYITEQQAAAVTKWKQAQNDLATVLHYASGELITLILPAVTQITRAITSVIQVIRDNSTYVYTFAGVVAAVYLPTIISATAATAAWAAALAVAAAPFIAIGVAIAGVALVLEDLYQYATGGRSVFGALVAGIPDVEASIDEFVAYMSGLVPELSGVFEAIGAVSKAVFGSVIATVHDLAMVLKAVGQVLTGDFAGAFNTLRSLWDRFAADVTGMVQALGQITANIFFSVIDTVKSAWTSIMAWMLDMLHSVPGITWAAGKAGFTIPTGDEYKARAAADAANRQLGQAGAATGGLIDATVAARQDVTNNNNANTDLTVNLTVNNAQNLNEQELASKVRAELDDHLARVNAQTISAFDNGVAR